MASLISLQGSNLGERHRYLNSLVTEAFKSKEPIDTVLKSPEYAPVDRLFKIDLASKHKHVEFILKNLQDDDMLYVSRALKSTWLLDEEYRYIIYPGYLEAALYPYMLTTAVNKMKHWIYLNLRDTERCQEFYDYYSTKEPKYAFKFLSNCPDEVILREFSKTEILEKVTPHQLKVICEETPAVAKLFFDAFYKNEVSTVLLYKYLNSGSLRTYFEEMKFILKTDTYAFLDIAEMCFLPYFKRLSKDSTKFIMTHAKDRFMKKPELYTARILNVSALAQCLTPDECEDLVIKLARAQFLQDKQKDDNWFNYKNVEPLLNRIDLPKRAILKKKLFVDKDVGEYVLTWPYDIPKRIDLDTNGNEVFLEKKYYNNFGISMPIMKRRQVGGGGVMPYTRKTLLDALFEEYRFSNFNKTMLDLRQKLKRESSSRNRLYMFLILVSKSGGRSENLGSLFELLSEYKNEPCQVRAAIIRSLVKRACIWRAGEDIWKILLIFARGLGLDGIGPEAVCIEGFHAVVMRTFLSNRECELPIKRAFLNNFSTFTEYLLTADEKKHIKVALLNMLINIARTISDPKAAVRILEQIIDTIQAHKIKLETYPDITAIIKNVQQHDPVAVESLLKRLFRSKLGRKELFKENFELVQTDASYVNALKHDITILSVDKFLEAVISHNLKAEQFLRKMSIYFNGNNDLAGCFLKALLGTKLHGNLARPICYLIGDGIKSYMQCLENNDEESKSFSALVKANAHVGRPALNLDSFEWQHAGAKFIAYRVTICKSVDINPLIKKLLLSKKTARLAIILAQRTSYEAHVFAEVAKIRPVIALKTALSYFRRNGDIVELKAWRLLKNGLHYFQNKGDQTDLQVWEIIEPLLVKVKGNPHLIANLTNLDFIPLNIRPRYLAEAFKVIRKLDYDKSVNLLWQINIILPKMDENFIEDVLTDFVEYQFAFPDNRTRLELDGVYTSVSLHLSILVRYLLLCTTKDDQTKRFENVGQLYLDRLELILLWDAKRRKKTKTKREYPRKGWKERFFSYLDVISQSLRYTEVFLNDEYVSFMPVMQIILEWMHGIVPVEKYFNEYVNFHLNMLYYKAIRETAKEFPGILQDRNRRHLGYKFFGETFGRYIGKEVMVLKEKYFDSVVFLYRKGLENYLKYFHEEINQVKPHIAKGILDSSAGVGCILAQNIDSKVFKSYLKRKGTLEMQFFCYNKI